MQTITITVDDATYSGAAMLGTNVFDFLSEHGRETEELLFETCGTSVSTQYTLAHAMNGRTLTAIGRVGEVVPCLTLEELVGTTV